MGILLPPPKVSFKELDNRVALYGMLNHSWKWKNMEALWFDKPLRYLSGRKSTCQCRRHGSDSWAGNGNPLQYSCLENRMDGGVWGATVHGVAKSWTQQSN